MNNIVEVRGLRKEFRKTVAIENLSFEVRQGEILGFLGANGAGKTTTIFMLLGLITPTKGTIKVFGRDLRSSRVEILQRMNFASAYQQLPYNLLVWENLHVFAEIYGVRNSKRKIDDLLEVFELSHMRKNLTGSLSSGEQTRLTLCKSLLNDPDLLLLDEPTASLDPDQADKVRKIIAARQRDTGMTVINTSHNMLDVSELCDRILFMQKGHVVANGSASELLDKFESKNLEEAFITMARTQLVEKV
ncbi:MAG: ABC transporter ATP-binding protein [Candidatus Obscuribacterales bacterium]|jgi:ABC-2 type transport system ATP-binding protein|nr:ABC transporter ATP-binding protein [Cyanobacteria bacterium SZAS LIN-5]RTL44851.1 MAG: ABC transporter ATP-binding protein [Candidatus Melainabacteria bacterium]